MAFKCLTNAYTILIGLVLRLRDKKEKDSPHPLGQRLLGTVDYGAFGTLQSVTLARVPQLLPQALACLQRVQGVRNESRGNFIGSTSHFSMSSQYQMFVYYQSSQNEPKPSQPENHTNLTSQSHQICDLYPKCLINGIFLHREAPQVGAKTPHYQSYPGLLQEKLESGASSPREPPGLFIHYESVPLLCKAFVTVKL